MITTGHKNMADVNISKWVSSRGYLEDERGILYNFDSSLAKEGFGLDFAYRIDDLHNKLNNLIRAFPVDKFHELDTVKEIMNAIGVYDVEYRGGGFNEWHTIEMSKNNVVCTWEDWMGDYEVWRGIINSDKVKGRVYILLSDEGVTYLNSLLPAKL